MNKYIGNKYGKLTVLKKYDVEVLSNSHTTDRYLCQCECGNERVVRIASLTSGHTRSCGCSRRDSLLNKNVIDLTGQRFGSWLVVVRDGATKHGEVLWRCRCDCGNERVFRSRALRNNQGVVCSKCKAVKLQSDRELFIHMLMGKRYGRWVVIGDGEPRFSVKANRYYNQIKCLCDCGVIKDVDQTSLLNNKSTSCGCYRKERVIKAQTFDDLSGQRFGNWLVEHRDDDRFYPGGGRSQMYRCKCDCGNTNMVARSMLVSGQSRSCGCLKQSRMELLVIDILTQLGLDFKHQVSFDGLRGVGGQRLSYDFEVNIDNRTYLIECQGEQHFHPVDYFGGHERFERQQHHDLLKRVYAMDNNFKLIEVDYKMSDSMVRQILNNIFIQD